MNKGSHKDRNIFIWTPIKHLLEQLIEINKSLHNVKPKQLNIYSKLRQSIKLSGFFNVIRKMRNIETNLSQSIDSSAVWRTPKY